MQPPLRCSGTIHSQNRIQHLKLPARLTMRPHDPKRLDRTHGLETRKAGPEREPALANR